MPNSTTESSQHLVTTALPRCVTFGAFGVRILQVLPSLGMKEAYLRDGKASIVKQAPKGVCTAEMINELLTFEWRK